MIRVKNFVPAISLEGFEGANDGRRGKGVFTKVQNAMKLLKKHNLPFGISTCYTSANYQDITSEAFFDMLIDAGTMFVWFSITCQLVMMQYLHFCQHRNSENLFMSVFGVLEKLNLYSVWIFRMMLNM